jgi:hypothetical protein
VHLNAAPITWCDDNGADAFVSFVSFVFFVPSW